MKKKFLAREITRERNGKTILIHGFELTRLGHSQALHKLSGSRKQNLLS